jgi:hypothetical protein
LALRLLPSLAMKLTLGSLASLFVLAGCGAGFDFGGFGSEHGLTGDGEVLTGDEGTDDGADDGADGDEDGDGGDDGDFDRDDCKIEDEDLGRTDVAIAFAGSTVRVSSWTEKADSPGEYVAFTLEVSGAPIVFTVKAGGESYEGSGDSWAHPNGDSGPDVSAISHIDFCDNGEPIDGDSGAEGEGEDDGDEGGDGGDGGDDGNEGGDCPPGTEGCDAGEGEGGGESEGEGEGEGTGDGEDDVCTAEICA